MSTTRDNLTARISKLVKLLLSSDKPGEVVAAVAAVNRSLAAAGLNHHDLGDAIEAGLVEVRSLAPPNGHTEDDWSGIAWFCHHHRDRLSTKEREFVRNMINRETEPSRKQMEWLSDIRERLTS
jgi:hypothetical protein